MFRFQGDTPDSLLDYLKSHWSHIRCRRKDLLLDTCYYSNTFRYNCWIMISFGKYYGHFSNASSKMLCQGRSFWIRIHCVMEYAFKVISRCLTSISLSTRFLLHFLNSESEAYFPWDPNTATVSILVFSVRHAVHYSLSCPVPSVGDFLYKGQPQSISSTSIRACSNTSACIQNTQKQFNFVSRDDEFCKRHDAYIQLNERTCPKRSITEQTFSVDAWLHTKFHLLFDVFLLKKHTNSKSLYNMYQAIFIIFLLSSTMFPSAQATRNNTSTDLHSFFSTPRSSINLHPLSFCDQYSISNHLSDEVCSLKECYSNDGSDCCIAIQNIKKEDNKARSEVEQFLNTMLKYATSQSYSIQWSAENCKAAYKNWICSEHHEYYEIDGSGLRRKKLPCLSICMTVESSCPFFRVHNKTKLYGGQPTFLCEGLQERDCYDMKGIMPEANFAHGSKSRNYLLPIDSTTMWSSKQTNISRTSNNEFDSLSSPFKSSTEIMVTTSANLGSRTISWTMLVLCYLFCISNLSMHL